jgi:hypothetical protein
MMWDVSGAFILQSVLPTAQDYPSLNKGGFWQQLVNSILAHTNSHALPDLVLTSLKELVKWMEKF